MEKNVTWRPKKTQKQKQKTGRVIRTTTQNFWWGFVAILILHWWLLMFPHPTNPSLPPVLPFLSRALHRCNHLNLILFETDWELPLCCLSACSHRYWCHELEMYWWSAVTSCRKHSWLWLGMITPGLLCEYGPSQPTQGTLDKTLILGHWSCLEVYWHWLEVIKNHQKTWLGKTTNGLKRRSEQTSVSDYKSEKLCFGNLSIVSGDQDWLGNFPNFPKETSSNALLHTQCEEPAGRRALYAVCVYQLGNIVSGWG